MQMVDGLAGTEPNIANCTKTVLDFPFSCNTGGDEVTMADEFSVVWLCIL